MMSTWKGGWSGPEISHFFVDSIVFKLEPFFIFAEGGEGGRGGVVKLIFFVEVVNV